MSPYGLVWCQSDGNPIHPRDDYKAWQRALVAAGMATVDPETEKVIGGMPLHAARHTTATLLMAARVDEKVRMEIMGQSSVQAQRGYVHVDTTHTRAALKALDGLL